MGGEIYLVSVAKAEKAAALLWRDVAQETNQDDSKGGKPEVSVDDLTAAPARAKAFSIGRCVFVPVGTVKQNNQGTIWELRRAERHLPPQVFDPSKTRDGVYKWDGRFDLSLPAEIAGTDSKESPQTHSFELLGTTPMPTLVEGAMGVVFRPAVLDGPINEHDAPIFDILDGKVSQN